MQSPFKSLKLLRIEEMYRMREHVVKQMDKNEDRLISLDEFLKVHNFFKGNYDKIIKF